jgi:hypothetical protein
MTEKVGTVLRTVLPSLDSHISDYLASVLADDPLMEVGASHQEPCLSILALLTPCRREGGV